MLIPVMPYMIYVYKQIHRTRVLRLKPRLLLEVQQGGGEGGVERGEREGGMDGGRERGRGRGEESARARARPRERERERERAPRGSNPKPLSIKPKP
jgi:hypothetical protein